MDKYTKKSAKMLVQGMGEYLGWLMEKKTSSGRQTKNLKSRA